MPEPLPPVDELTYEQARDELESILAALESEKQSLEQAMALYARGVELTRRCTALLDQAELKVQHISGEDILPFNG